MHCTITDEKGQEATVDFNGTIPMPSSLFGFCIDRDRPFSLDADGRTVHLHGHVADAPAVCDRCGGGMHVNGSRVESVRHVPLGDRAVTVKVETRQYRCPGCGRTRAQRVPFRHARHRVSHELHSFVVTLLARGLTVKAVAGISGVGRNVVRAIDLDRLKRLYTEDGRLRRPERQARALAVDEFKLHDGHRYATHVIDLDTGEVLWIAEGKSKSVVADFIDFVGEGWMRRVEAVACDMNAGFCAAFLERCPHLTVVYDHFHVVKNFNDHVLSAIRKDEYARLVREGRDEEAARLKRSRYILTAGGARLRDGTPPPCAARRRGGGVFGLAEGPTAEEAAETDRRRRERYAELVSSNELLAVADIVKDHLECAYRETERGGMERHVDAIVDTCRANGNARLGWFARFLESHREGIVAHAERRISSGRIEGINNRIKTLRRQSYGLPDTEYFFLKVIDSSRRAARERSPVFASRP